MARYLGLLRAVNVGGTGKLPMADLRDMASGLGFGNVRTYIASGNLIFDTDMPRTQARAALEQAVQGWFGQPVPIYLRTLPDIDAVLRAVPWPEAPGNRVAVIFGDAFGPIDIRHRTDEDVVPGETEVFVHYPSGMGRSRLVLKGADAGTARNLNTVRKVAALLAD